MNSLYREDDYRYTPDGAALDSEATKALESVFAKYLALGYSPREISHIIKHVVTDFELEAVLDYHPTVDAWVEAKSLPATKE